jgi:adenosine kinase
MGGEELSAGLEGAKLLICNEYEFELIRQKTGLDEAQILTRTDALIVTRGEHGSWIYEKSGRVEVPAVVPHQIVDPTGVGDAFRGGLMKGLALGLGFAEAARLGSVAATYALEHLGGTSHTYSAAEFTKRYEEHFGPLEADEALARR